ncbi:ABC transporter permease [Streptacidiphilus jiangxiensis]|uniref:Transport permease protein n=1 Tax=Streptacidiphilus jiangxiensis TaxID=235985 RepID=A0A1H7VHH6_STRJI|nr:ABC transporter permease [Streptacidiphilus jiangxiensis]SEM08721.1 oleandomycin transport system permease protein [Streptacidiphilus jiangxiensis]
MTTLAAPALAAPAVPAGDNRTSLRASLHHIGALTRRNLMRMKADPESLLDALFMPILFTVLFVYVFGGAVAGNSHNYIQYMIPGMFGQIGLSLAMAVGTGLNTDFTTGVMDRFRTMPIARSSVLIAKLLAESCRSAVSLVVLVLFAMCLGLRIHTSPVNVLATLGLALAFGTGMVWVSMLLGMAMPNPQAVQGVGMLIIVPLQFGSSTFAPVHSMPGWLQAFTSVNPLSALADASRALINGGPVLHPALLALAWSVGLTVVFAPLAVARFRKRT